MVLVCLATDRIPRELCHVKRLPERQSMSGFHNIFDETFKNHYLKLCQFFLEQTESFGRDEDLAHELATDTIMRAMTAYKQKKIDKAGIYEAIQKEKRWTAKDFHLSTFRGQGKHDRFSTSRFSEVDEASYDDLESSDPVDGVNPFRIGWELEIEKKLDRMRINAGKSDLIREAIDLIEIGWSLSEITKAYRKRKKTLSDNIRSVYRDYLKSGLI